MDCSFLLAQTPTLCLHLDPDKTICGMYMCIISNIAWHIVDQLYWSKETVNRSNLDPIYLINSQLVWG